MKNSFGIDPEIEEGDPYYNIISCSDVANIWEEFELESCPICGAEMNEIGLVIHQPTNN